MRRINIKLLVGLFVAVILIAAGVHGLHLLQAQRNAGKLLKSADQAEKSGRLDRSQEFLDRYLYFDPENPDVLARYAGSLSRAHSADQTAKAVELLEKSIRLHPDRTEDRRTLAKLLLELRRYVDVREHANYLLAKGGEKDGVAEYLLASCELEDGKYAEAISLLKDAKKNAPKTQEIYPFLAMLLRKHATPPQPAEADKVMDELIAVDPNGVRPYLERSRYREQAKLPGAEEDALHALKLDPKNADALLTVARLVEEKGDLKRAYAYREQGLKDHPNDPRMYFWMARLERKQRDLTAAREILKQAVSKFPGIDHLKMELVGILLELNEYYDAKEQLQKLRDIGFEPELQEILKARADMGLGNWDDAEKSLIKVRELLVASRPDEVQRIDFYLAQCYEQTRQPDKLKQIYERMITARPTSSVEPLAYAQSLEALGLSNQALDVIRKAPGNSPAKGLMLAALLTRRNARLPISQQRWDEVDQALSQAEKNAQGDKELTPDAKAGLVLQIAIRRAAALEAQGKLNEAQSVAEKARDAQPGQLLAWLTIAAILEKRGMYDAIPPLLDQAEAKVGDKVDLKSYRIRYAARHGGPSALKTLEELAKGLDKRTPQEQEVLLRNLTDAYRMIGDTQRSSATWAKVVARKPNDLDVQGVAFELASRANDEKAMLAALEQIRRIEKEDGPVYLYEKASYLVWKAEKGDKSVLPEAQRLLAVATNKKKDWSRVPLLLARIAELNDDPSAALGHAMQAIDAGERNPELIRRTLEQLYKNGRFADATTVLNKFQDQPLLSGEFQRYATEYSLRYQAMDQARALAEKAVAPDSQDYRDQMWLGQVMAATGRLPDAERHLRRAVALAGDEPAPSLVLLSYLVKHGERSQAAEFARQAAEKFSSKKQPMIAARCLELVGQGEEALKLYQAALAASPDDEVTLRNYIDFLISHKRLREAEAPLERLIALRSKSSDVSALQNLYSEVLSAQKDPARAQKALELVSAPKAGQDVDPKEADNRLRARVKVLANQGGEAQRLEAIALMEGLVNREQTAADRFKLAELYEQQGNWPKAKESLIAVARTEKANVGLLVVILEALIRHKETAEAKPWLDELEKLEPRTLRTAQLKAAVLHGQNHTDQAVSVLEEFASRNEAEAAAVALTLERIGQFAPAEAMFRKAAAKNADAKLMLGAFLGRRGRIADSLEVCDSCWDTSLPPQQVARTCVSLIASPKTEPAQRLRVQKRLDEALRKAPKDKELLLALASVHYFEEHYKQSEEMYRQALAQDKNEQAALNNLAWLLGHEKGKQAEGLELIERAITSVGPRAALLDTRGVIHLAMGNTDLAIKDLESATAADPQSPAKWFHLAQAYWGAKRRDDADKAVKKAIELGLEVSTLDPLERPDYERLTAELGKK